MSSPSPRPSKKCKASPASPPAMLLPAPFKSPTPPLPPHAATPPGYRTPARPSCTFRTPPDAPPPLATNTTVRLCHIPDNDYCRRSLFFS